MARANSAGKMMAARYASVVLIVALAAAGTYWLRASLIAEDVVVDEEVVAGNDTVARKPLAPSNASNTDRALENREPKRKLQWQSVDGGAQVVHSADARERWERERKRIYEGLREQKNTLEANTFDAGLGGPKPGTLDKEYIQAAVSQLKPLLRECYELTLSDDQRVAGKLTVAFSIAGDSKGGIVESAEIADGATAKHAVLRECIRETIYILELPAPEGGGIVHVRYPFEFSNTPVAPDAGG